MGLPPTLSQTDDRFMAAVRRVRDAAHKHQVPAGIMVAGLEDAQRWLAEGFIYFGVTSEIGFMVSGMTQFLRAARSSS
jgi:2-keto-3-deoxy-L-rhamnonate aldolase RhmA